MERARSAAIIGCAGFIVGASLAEIARPHLALFLTVALLSTAAVLLLPKGSALIVAVAIFTLVLGGAYETWQRHRRIVAVPYGQAVQFKGFVASIPDLTYGIPSFLIQTAAWGRPVRVQVTAQGFWRYGDTVSANGLLAPPAAKPSYDYPGVALKNGLVGTLKKPTVEKIGAGGGNRLLGWLYRFKATLDEQITRLLPGPADGLLQGILVGTRAAIPQDLSNAFNRTGTTHIVALSGYNISIVARTIGAGAVLSGPFLGFWLTAVSIILFVLMTGASASVVRAGIMGIIILWGARGGRKADLLLVTVAAATIMTIVNPLIARFDVGFQLSVAATIGIIILHDALFAWINRRALLRRLPLLMKEALAATLAAELATLPIILGAFGRLSLIAPLSNVLVLPAIPLSMGLGAIALAASFLWLPFGVLLAKLTWIPLAYVLTLVKLLAVIPLASVTLPPFPWWWAALWYGGLLLLAYRSDTQSSSQSDENSKY